MLDQGQLKEVVFLRDLRFPQAKMESFSEPGT